MTPNCLTIWPWSAFNRAMPTPRFHYSIGVLLSSPRVQGMYVKAQYLASKGFPQQALSRFEQAATQDPGSYDAFYNVAVLRLGDPIPKISTSLWKRSTSNERSQHGRNS